MILVLIGVKLFIKGKGFIYVASWEPPSSANAKYSFSLLILLVQKEKDLIQKMIVLWLNNTGKKIYH